MSCLIKQPEARPANAEVLEAALAKCAAAGRWGHAEAEERWRKRNASPVDRTQAMTAQPAPVLAR